MILARLTNDRTKDALVRVIVKSTKTCRVSFDSRENHSDATGFIVPTEQLVFVDQVQGMVDIVKIHAKANYDKDGWDIVVESYEDSEIAYVIRDCRSNEAAIRKMHSIVKLLDERRQGVTEEISSHRTNMAY